VQAAWLALFLSVAGFYLLGLAEAIAAPVSDCLGSAPGCTGPAAEAELARVGLTPKAANAIAFLLIQVIVPAGCLMIAAFIAWRRPDRAITLAVAGTLALYGPAINTDLVTAGLASLGLGFASVIYEFLFTVLILVMVFTFPSGRFAPAWAGWVMLAGLGAHLVYALTTGLETISDLTTPLIIALLLGLGLQVYRYRRVASEIEKQQTKWVMAGTVGFLLNAVLYFAVVVPINDTSPSQVLILIFSAMNVVLVLSLPATLMVASLRYRLWDIDVIIRRTLVYALLTGLLTLAYLGLVVVLQTAASGLTGQRDSALVTVLSTLGIAALFAPLRRGIQRFVDRRFYRRKYDAAQTLSAFAAHSRDQVDIDRLVNALSEVVDETMQPERVGVWLKN